MQTDKQSAMQSALVRLKSALKKRGDAAEARFNRAAADLRAFISDEVLPLIDSVLAERPDLGPAVPYALMEFMDNDRVQDRVAEIFGLLDSDARCGLIQSIGLGEVARLEPILAMTIRSDPDPRCRSEAIRVAGVLKSEQCWPLVLELAESSHPDLEGTLKDYGRIEGEPYLRRVFESDGAWASPADDYPPSPMREEMIRSGRRHRKIFAAWGLAKFGDRTAVKFLGEALSIDDCSFRAAQGLADVFELPFEWHSTYRDQVRVWWRKIRAEI